MSKMNNEDSRIPEKIAPQIFALASRLYAAENQGYSLTQLIEAGREAQIPPEYVQQALQQLQAKQIKKSHRQNKVKLALLSAGAAIAIWSTWTYNSLSGAAQRVDSTWAQVENQFQRRSDLIPNLVSVTQAHAKHESYLVTQLIQARQNYLKAENQPQSIAAVQEMNQAIDKFQDYVVRNPQLQSAQMFINLQYELTGTENRIAVERMRYNHAVQDYNNQVKSFPNTLVSPMFGFYPRPFFKAQTTDVPAAMHLP